MASINGVTIKSLKRFRDHEGFGIYQGNVYYKGKKLGFWSEDSWGGEDLFDFDSSILDDEVERLKKSDWVVPEYRSLVNDELLLSAIVELIDIEKFYKKCAKNGCTAVVANVGGSNVEAYATVGTKSGIEKSAEYRKFKSEHESARIFTSLDDFDVEV